MDSSKVLSIRIGHLIHWLRVRDMCLILLVGQLDIHLGRTLVIQVQDRAMLKPSYYA